MKKFLVLFSLIGMAACFLMTTGCQRSSDEVWNDSQSAGRHVARGVNTLGGKHGESRQVRSSSDFTGDRNDDFVSLDNDSKNQNIHSSDEALPQPKEGPGELGSRIPGIEGFRDPQQDAKLAPIFQRIGFEYNSSLIKGDENFTILHKIAEYLKKNNTTYIFVEGHCDKRGPAAYNLALGANRANAIRTLLAKEGVDSEHVFTISYGKERPIADGDTEDAYRQNRRAQFRIYDQR
jgi:peptidoglycan-associated lipoprotein